MWRGMTGSGTAGTSQTNQPGRKRRHLSAAHRAKLAAAAKATAAARAQQQKPKTKAAGA
jgi:hypothetical protein